MQGIPTSRSRPFVVAFGAVLLAIVLLRVAWICDDAFITFRTIDNFVSGLGLTWNPPVRVQAYTHPLWMFVLTGLYVLTDDLMYTTMLLSVLLSVVAFVVVGLRLAVSPLNVLVMTGVLVFSKAFVEYSTAGLENPMTHLLLVVFIIAYLRRRPDFRSLLGLTLLASLVLLNRMDAILLVLPALVHAALRVRPRPMLAALALGFVPFALWELFSLFYYGFPFPNTAYAKLSTGIPTWALAEQGLYYVLDSIQLDPITMTTILAGVTIPLVRRDRASWTLALGVLLYVLYVIKIGGCFMSGRFFTAPLMASVAIIASTRISPPSAGAAAVAITVAIGWMNPMNPWRDEHRGIVNGIADERHVYCTATCLVRSSRLQRLPRDYPFIRDAENKRAQARRRKNKDEKFVVQTMSIGMLGYHCGPRIHIIDLYGLTDPLLARLPILEDPNWRIGHFIRKVPVGYRESIATGTNQIQERDLARLYDVLTLIDQGPLLSGRRLLEIVKINLGLYSDLVDPDRDRFFDMPRVVYSQVNDPKQPGTPWYTEGNWFLPDEGIEIRLEGTVHNRGIEVSFDNNDDYQIFYYLGEVQVGSSKVERKKYKKGGLRTYEVDVPEEAVDRGYDLIVIEPLSGDGRYVMGHLRLVR